MRNAGLLYLRAQPTPPSSLHLPYSHCISYARFRSSQLECNRRTNGLCTLQWTVGWTNGWTKPLRVTSTLLKVLQTWVWDGGFLMGGGKVPDIPIYTQWSDQQRTILEKIKVQDILSYYSCDMHDLI